MEVDGVAPSIPKTVQTPKKQNDKPDKRSKKEQDGDGKDALETLKRMAGDTSKRTAIIDVVKTSITGPFLLLQKFKAVGACRPDVAQCVLRRSISYLWCEKCPPLIHMRK